VVKLGGQTQLNREIERRKDQRVVSSTAQSFSMLSIAALAHDRPSSERPQESSVANPP
jgi:hypothetical protein